jgi:hypothetical protein
MRMIASAVFFTCAVIATPSVAATYVGTSVEGAITEMQKRGPYATVRGPDRSGRYFLSGAARQDRPLWRYRWNPVLVR